MVVINSCYSFSTITAISVANAIIRLIAIVSASYHSCHTTLIVSVSDGIIAITINATYDLSITTTNERC